MSNNEHKKIDFLEGTMKNHHGGLKLLTGSSHPQLAERIASKLGIELVKTELGEFDNGEIRAQVAENVRGFDVFYLASLHAIGGQRTIGETELLIDCIRDSAGRINCILPWIGYSKQDRRTRPRESRSFRVVAKRLSASGIHRAMLFDLHNSATADFFDIPTDHVYLMKVIIEEIKKRGLGNIVIASPDIGSGKRTDAVARLLGIQNIAIVWKIHDPETKELDLSKSQVLGNVKGKDIWLVDDLIQSGGTLCLAAELLKEAGAKTVHAAAVHADFTPAKGDKLSAVDKLMKSAIDEVIVTDSIPQSSNLPAKIKVLEGETADFIAEAIELLHNDKQLSPLFLKY